MVSVSLGFLKLMLSFQLVGGHIISGNVFEPVALDELLPHWRQEQVCLYQCLRVFLHRQGKKPNVCLEIEPERQIICILVCFLLCLFVGTH